jgi:hypothetical protein
VIDPENATVFVLDDALALNSSAVLMLRGYHQPIVKYSWVIDSWKKGESLPLDAYLIEDYEPRPMQSFATPRVRPSSPAIETVAQTAGRKKPNPFAT